MEQVYIDTAKMLRAMSDPKRLRIVDMLSCGEMCACKILEKFQITQPTLSHDMKVAFQISRTALEETNKKDADPNSRNRPQEANTSGMFVNR